jgi:DNA-binding transcriptional ArsR family regulator
VTQISKQRPRTPKQAARCCRPVDARLDAEFFKALGDPTRLGLLACLFKCGRACSVSEIAECCHVDFSVVSRHLQALERAGIVEATRDGRSVLYQARFEHVCGVLRSLADAIEECGPCPGDPSTEGACCAR